ncbi:MAG TPA: SLBB domain-containing protein [Syntrophorhabdaceae bacterium]|nr:SLBB domain-containing protein [Syntrophorhabdaceae bacterium]
MSALKTFLTILIIIFVETIACAQTPQIDPFEPTRQTPATSPQVNLQIRETPPQAAQMPLPIQPGQNREAQPPRKTGEKKSSIFERLISDQPLEITDQQFTTIKKFEGITFSYSSKLSYVGQVAVAVKIVRSVGRSEGAHETFVDMDAGYMIGTPDALAAAFRIFGITTSFDISTTVKQFGYELFREPAAFVSGDRVPVGPEYVIGPGDEIRVTIWGNIEGQWNMVVDKDGHIALPKAGILGVSGLTFKELKEALYKQLSKYFTNFEMNVGMGALRTIQVYVVGNAQRPGAYTISSLSSLVNALFEAGGPSKNGTMRDIQVNRNGKTVVHFDMYDFLLKGDKSKDLRLMPEDVIFVPPVMSLVAIVGNVKNPAIYEFKEELRIADLLKMAGGLAATAFKGRVQVQRIDNHAYRTIFESDLIDMGKDLDKNFALQDGDLVKLFSVKDVQKVVSLSGAVAHAGDFGITPGLTTIKDIISLSGGLLYYASNQAELTRVRVTETGPMTERFSIDLKKAMENDATNNMKLEANDYLMIHAVPEWQASGKINVQGEVKLPGVYVLKKGEKLSSIIERTGGYTDRAYLRGAVFTRERVKDLQQKNLDEMVSRLEREIFSSSISQVSTATSQEEVAARKEEFDQKQKFIASLRGLKATGRLTIRLAHLRLLKGSEYDIELEDGDSLFIPMINNVVNVTGAVMFQGSFVYSENLGYKNYVDLSGGYSRFADQGNVYILKIDGSAMKTRSVVSWNPFQSRWELTAFGQGVKEIEPGDTIVVPEKIEHVAWLRDVKDITQILANVALTAGIFKALY